MSAPAHLGRSRPFFAEALDAPGIDEIRSPAWADP
jgi:hypothetical protein